MTKDELIAKQQLEIEELKASLAEYRETCDSVSKILWRPEQWGTKYPDFPKVAMTAIVRAQQLLR